MSKKRTFFENIRLFFLPVKENKKIFIKGYFVAFLWGISGIIHVLFLERISYYLEAGNKEAFLNILFYYLIYIFIYEIINFLVRKWGWVEVIPGSWSMFSNNYLEKYIKLDNNIVELEGTGKLISIIYGGIRQWGFSLWNSIEIGFRLIISIVFGFYMVSSINLYYSGLFLLLFILFSIISIYFSNKLNLYRKQRNENMNVISKKITKLLMNKTEILQTNNIKRELDGIIRLYNRESYINKIMGTNRQFMKRNSDFGIALFFVGSYYFLGNMYFGGDIGLNIIVGFAGALILMQRSISEALSFYVQFSKDFIIIDKMWNFFDTTPQIKGYETGNTFIYKKGNIKIKNLNYYYTKGKLVFKDFNLEIDGEKILALVGNSGSGKSTLAKLISGYIHPSSGDIVVDGQKLNEVSLKSYYKEIGYLTQEPSVFDGTVLDNLTYAINRELLEGELEKIIKLSKCEFIYELPAGLDTEIGERGVKLSGGQKQRLAIAKIFLKNPKIIILDEPTSALDSFSEEQITKAMHNLFKNRTVIVIAHRLQTVKHADKIIVLENGEIVETWNHKELVKQKGIYKRMLDLQSGF